MRLRPSRAAVSWRPVSFLCGTRSSCAKPSWKRQELAAPWRERLQFLDLDLAEFHRADAELQGDVPFIEQAVANVDGLLAVERDRQMAAIGAALLGAPLAAGLGHRVDFGDVDDRGGAVGRVRALVEDIVLVA